MRLQCRVVVVPDGRGGLNRSTFFTFSNTNPTTLQYVPEPTGSIALVSALIGIAPLGAKRRPQRWIAAAVPA